MSALLTCVRKTAPSSTAILTFSPSCVKRSDTWAQSGQPAKQPNCQPVIYSATGPRSVLILTSGHPSDSEKGAGCQKPRWQSTKKEKGQKKNKNQGTPRDARSGGCNSSFHLHEMDGCREERWCEWEVERREETGVCLTAAMSKQSTERLAVFHAAERTHAKSPLLSLSPSPSPLSISRSLFFFFFLNVSTRVNPCRLPEAGPCPRKHLRNGRVQERAPWLTIVAEASPSLSASLLFFLTFIYYEGVGGFGGVERERGVVGGGGVGCCQCDLDIQGWGGELN